MADGEALTWKDYVALFIALLRTTLLPLVIMALVIFLIAVLLGFVRTG